MAESGIPLPTDEQLPPEAVKLLSSLPPLNVFRAVAGLPRSLRPFLELGGSILGASNLTPQERELAILRVARLTPGAEYEWVQHVPILLALGGSHDMVQLSRLKKRKLQLKDQIAKINNQLLPDIIA